VTGDTHELYNTPSSEHSKVAGSSAEKWRVMLVSAVLTGTVESMVVCGGVVSAGATTFQG
jgi:hypothetical protein